MAAIINSFNEYVEEGSKLSNFADMFSSLEQMGKELKSIKGTVDSVTNLSFLTSIRDKFSAATSLNDKISSALKNMGLSDKAISLLNKSSGGLLSSVDPFIMSIYGSVETFAGSILQDVISSVMSKIFIPEEVFLIAVKGLAGAKSDPNYKNVLRKATLEHDLVKTIEWLDNFNNTKYAIQSKQTQDALTAARNGSFNVAAYIIRKLKKTYIEIKAGPTITEKDEERKSLELVQYEHFFNKVIQHIFVYSYDNLTVEKFQAIIRDFPTFTPSCLGTSDTKYSSRAIVTKGNIDILAPLKKYKTVEVIWNSNASEKTFIVPRNHNIKKLYVWLAFSPAFNDSERLVNKPLHDRLKYKILSTLEEAFYEAQKSLLNSALGKFITNAKDDYLGLIAKYVKETEQYLFDPKKQDFVTGEDRITLPDFRQATVASSTKKDSQKNYLPIPSVFSEYSLTYDNFYVYHVMGDYTAERVVQDGIVISKKNNMIYMFSNGIFKNSPLMDKVSEEIYFIYHNERFNTVPDQIKRQTITDFVLAKHIIDYYSTQEVKLPLTVIASMYPSINNKGIFNEFVNYYNYVNYNQTIESEDNSGLNRDVEEINFYNQVLTDKGETVKIDPTGVNVYNVFGEKVGSYSDLPGVPVGVSIVGEDVYAATLNQKNGHTEAYYSPDNGMTWISLGAKEEDITIYPGVGITSLNQVNFYESLYYDDNLFIINNNKISFSSDKTNYTELPISFLNQDEIIQSIIILPNGDFLILTDKTLYKIQNFNKDETNFQIETLDENGGKYNTIKGMVGTIINAVSIPLDTIDDFDIDDTKIVNKLMQHYSSVKLVYYWYSTESKISESIFNDNIFRLQEKLNATTDPYRRSQLQHLIERQQHFKSKIA
jgi:hypothetical protein